MRCIGMQVEETGAKIVPVRSYVQELWEPPTHFDPGYGASLKGCPLP
jgi:hypothetical protein